MVGRSEELAALERLLTDPDCRLLTLTGPPGIGKTRLAVTAAAAWAVTSDHAVVFVELAELRDPDAVFAALAGALGVDRPGPSSLVDLVADCGGPVLAVLDNFEHLLAAAPDVGSVVAECPSLRVLVTSRERLRLSGEREFPVAPLPIPSPADATDLAAIASNPCVSLLLNRAQRVRPQFELTAANASAIIAACASLEGIPLALELAATRLKALNPDELVSRLSGRMWLLQSRDRNVATRHRALSAAIAWSYDLLDPAERALFERLSVFAGGWSIDEVAGVCELPADEALLLVESLLDKSLIERVDSEGPAQFRMLESLREYAAERLADSGSEASAVASHVAFYATLAERFEAAIGLSAERESVAALGRHRANLRTALDRSLSRDGVAGTTLSLAAAVGWYCHTRGSFAEGRQLLDRALATANPDGAGVAYTAALLGAGVLAWGSDELGQAGSLLEQAFERCGRAHDVRRETIASAFLGHVSRAGGRFGEAARWHQRAELGYRRMHNPQGTAWVRYDLGLLARDRGDLAVADRLLRESLREFRDLDYPWAVSSAAWGLAVVLCARGSVDEARALLGEALTLAHDLHDAHGVTQCLEALAQVACGRAEHVTAAMLLGYTAARRRHLEAPLSEADRTRTAALEAALVRAMGPAAERARRDGRLLGTQQAVALGHAVADGQIAVNPSAPSTVLTRREGQVVALVAAGRTNRQIGSALGIAEKTAEVHVQHVMAKVGAHNRAEVAAWAVRQGLH